MVFVQAVVSFHVEPHYSLTVVDSPWILLADDHRDVYGLTSLKVLAADDNILQSVVVEEGRFSFTGVGFGALDVTRRMFVAANRI